MLAQTLEANGAVVYILGRRQEVLDQAAATAVCISFLATHNTILIIFVEAWQNLHYQGRRHVQGRPRSCSRLREPEVRLRQPSDSKLRHHRSDARRPQTRSVSS